MTYYKIFYEAVNEICGNRAAKVLMAYGPKIEASDKKGGNYNTLQELAVWLLVQANILNRMHWNTDTNFSHEILNEAYDLCRDVGDALAEKYVGATGEKVDAPFPSATDSVDVDKDSAVKMVKNIRDHMARACSKNPGFSEGIKNIFADFDDKIDTIIYKMSRFKS